MHGGRPSRGWIVVYPDAEMVTFGPDFRPETDQPAGRCPAYVAVDATSGRAWGSFQTCDPPYRGWRQPRRNSIRAGARTSWATPCQSPGRWR
jgi:hypothetical protein